MILSPTLTDLVCTGFRVLTLMDSIIQLLLDIATRGSTEYVFNKIKLFGDCNIDCSNSNSNSSKNFAIKFLKNICYYSKKKNHMWLLILLSTFKKIKEDIKLKPVNFHFHNYLKNFLISW